eukprot:7787569-Prorocentrum_lima.AAC.1
MSSSAGTPEDAAAPDGCSGGCSGDGADTGGTTSSPAVPSVVTSFRGAHGKGRVIRSTPAT